ATECDLDHHHDYARGGRTDDANLGPGCQHDHQNKTTRGWRLIRTQPNRFTWISPLGRRHVVHAPPVAPPLPDPIPRTTAHRAPPNGPPFSLPPELIDPHSATFQPLTRRGRPPASTAHVEEPHILATTGPDPPPF
ncbi:MAG: hypothetical protein QOI15_567, partial [Pseudonocardiales bacterium]|nr:hypothetical protein [Pseudonocardiales bacterium]